MLLRFLVNVQRLGLVRRAAHAILAAAVIGACVSGSAATSGADSLAKYRELAKKATSKNDFVQLVTQLEEFVRTDPRAKTPEMDYWLGRSYCGAGDPISGAEILRGLLRQRLDPQNVDAVKKQLSACEDISARDQKLSIPQFTGPHLHYDGGHYDKPFFTLPVEKRSVSESELSQRLFPIRELEAARVRLAGTVARNFTTAAIGRFVIAGQYMNSKEVESMGRGLEAYVQFYNREYEMPIPENVISIYDPGGVEDVIAYAAQFHGLSLPPDVWAYSMYEDLSVAVAGDGPQGYGHLKHELLHLMIRGSFDDCPPWLEEGLALAYTASAPDANGILAGWDSRIKDMRTHLRALPHLSELFAASWDDFNVLHGTELRTKEADQVAFIQAFARSFAVYLQDRNQLRAVYFAERNRSFGGSSGPYPGDGVVVEQTLHLDRAGIEADFADWLAKKVR